MTLRYVLLGFGLVALPAFGQGAATEPTEGPVEIRQVTVNEIPPQYRATANKPRKPFAVRYTCPESGRLYVLFDNAEQTATVEMGQTTRYLRQAPSADGGRYANSDESYVFWVKGKRATINGREICEAD
jgi:membrane-bound inhibitor of C-type lysozyme